MKSINYFIMSCFGCGQRRVDGAELSSWDQVVARWEQDLPYGFEDEVLTLGALDRIAEYRKPQLPRPFLDRLRRLLYSFPANKI